jgi:hypothetical protein
MSQVLTEPTFVKPEGWGALPCGERIVVAARSFIGVPWEHQGRSWQGIDCCGYIAEVALLSEAVPDVNFERDYRRSENGERMLALLRRYLDPVEPGDEQVGDILALCDEQLREPLKPVHLSILTQTDPYWMMIHASAHGVREHRMDVRFRQRVVSAWRARRR